MCAKCSAFVSVSFSSKSCVQCSYSSTFMYRYSILYMKLNANTLISASIILRIENNDARLILCRKLNRTMTW